MRIIGHRGAAGHAPENTCRSLEKALELGAGWVEVDLRLSLDGVPVVIHDATLDRTTTGEGPVRARTLAQLRALDAGDGQKIPTAREVMDLLRGRVGLNLEIKDPQVVMPLASELGAALQSGWRAEDLLVSSFDRATLRAFRSACPEVPLGALFAKVADGFAGRARALGARVAGIPASQFRAERAEEAHAEGLRLYVFTANDREAILRLAREGADGVFTDFPDRVLAALGSEAPSG